MLIGLTGYAGAGKDTIYGLLDQFFGPANNIKFAGKLKDLTACLLGVPPSSIEDLKVQPQYKWFLKVKHAGNSHYDDHYGSPSPEPFSMRMFLQRLGNDGRRILGDDLWIRLALPHPAEYYETGLHVVTDVRYPNEAERIRELGGLVVRVVRKGQKKIAESSHVSEAGLPDNLVDWVIHNDQEGMPDVMLSQVMRFMYHYGEKSGLRNG